MAVAVAAPSVPSAPARLAATHPAAVTTAANAVNTVGVPKTGQSSCTSRVKSLGLYPRKRTVWWLLTAKKKKKEETNDHTRSQWCADEWWQGSDKQTTFQFQIYISYRHGAALWSTTRNDNKLQNEQVWVKTIALLEKKRRRRRRRKAKHSASVVGRGIEQ